MRATRSWILGVCAVLVCTLSASGQGQTRKAGLWDISTTTTSALSGNRSAPAPAIPPHITSVCLSPELIEKYGAPLPLTTAAGCTVKFLDKKPNSVMVRMECVGKMSGIMTAEESWTEESAKGVAHFVGTMENPGGTRPVEWTSNSAAIFKAPECGAVKPYPMPADANPAPAVPASTPKAN